MNKIAIVGIMGSGKSTLANKLGTILGIEVFHLDKEHWLPNWTEKHTPEGWVEYQNNLVSKEKWVIDGNHRRTIDIRLNAADTIIYFDFPKLFCVYRVFKRLFDKEVFDKAEGMKNRVTWTIIKNILNYPKKEIGEKIKECKKTKKVFVLKNHKDVDVFYRSLLG